jgi:NADH dehydrogenase
MQRRILVLGGTGFVGRHIVANLVTAGHQVVVPTRSRERGKHLILLPTVDLVECDIHDRRRLGELVDDADTVVNLVGILHETGHATFARVHVELAQIVIDACRRAGVRRLVHMSALGAAADAPSRYQRSKGEAQALVEASELDWTVFRPSVIFGRGDSFLSLFAKLVKWMPVVFLAAPEARFQPVYVGDVARCFARSIDDKSTVRHRYEVCGPKVYTLRELVAWVAETTGHVRPIIGLGPTLSRFQASLLEVLPVKLMTRDNLASMRVDNVCQASFPAVFGIEPAALEAIAPEYLAPAAIHSRFDPYRARSGHESGR